MSASTTQPDFFESKVLGHPAGLFVLFFTEMWERFSFYGMRVLLVNFLTMAAIGYNPGWEWSAENAGALFGTYAMLLYITPILGGIIADKLTGYNWAVVIGSIIMTLGHASMAAETELSLYLGLGLLVVGTGFFKPNITSIISEMYKYLPEKKDGAYTIFYMGVNAGAFFGMLLCGYLAEKIGWSWGFGLAGVFMLFGTLQFWLAKPLFGAIGERPKNKLSDESVPSVMGSVVDQEDVNDEINKEKPNPFTTVDKILIALTAIIGLGYAINDPMSKIMGLDLFAFAKIGNFSGQYVMVLIALALFLVLVISRIGRYSKGVRERMIAFVIFAFFTVFFFTCFEQGASSLIIFARDYVDRSLSGGAAFAYNLINTLLTTVPLAIITYVLYLLAKQTFKKIPGSNIILAITFIGVWSLTLWMLNRDWSTSAYLVSFDQIEQPVLNDNGEVTLTDAGDTVFQMVPVTESMVVENAAQLSRDTLRIGEVEEFEVGDQIPIITKEKDYSNFGYLPPSRLEWARERGLEMEMDNGVVIATVEAIKDDEVEITVSWFSILNSFFIIAFAPFFSRWFDSRYNPSAAYKYGLGLIIMAIGFGLLAWGSSGVASGVKVSMIWLILAYLFHTLGELSLSPVGLSYVSKLVPARMIAFMFGMWYLAIAIGNIIAAVAGGYIETIQETYSLSAFFLLFTIIPAVAGIAVILMNPFLKRIMHGVK